ncbi:MAG TPA: hypothetical protein VF176_01375 [Solirubrobacterales bacterium]
MPKSRDRGLPRWTCLLATVACMAAVASENAGAAQRVHQPGGAAASATAAALIARVQAYWTPKRMQNARPLDGGRGTASLSSAGHTSVSQPTTPPFSFNGRLFVRQGGQSGFCSGTAIDSPTRQLVLTAAHCVNSGPVNSRRQSFWSQYLEFVPAYTRGQAPPFGTFVAQRGRVYAPAPWAKQGNPNFDVGAFLVYPNAAAQNLADAVGGGAKVAYDLSRKQQFQSFAYPGNSGQMQECDSPYFGSDRFTFPLSGKPTMAIHCRWSPGASGGGWLINGTTTINGLNSYLLRRNRSRTFGPYFNSGNVGRLIDGL